MKKLLFVVSLLVMGIIAHSCTQDEPKVALEEIQLNFNEMKVRMNQFYQMTPSFRPTNAYYKDLVWTSSDTTIATINENGMVSTKDTTGKVMIVALHNAVNQFDNTVSDTCYIMVKPTTLASVTLNVKDYKTVALSEDLQLKATISPDTARYKDIEWVSSDPVIATVNAEGLVHFNNASGNVVISAVHKAVNEYDDEVSGSCKILVEPIQPTAISLLPSTAQLLTGGQTVQLHAQIVPSNATYHDFVWTSSDPSVATVTQEGLVTTTQKAGSVIITATHFAFNEMDKQVTATAQIDVIKNEMDIEMIAVEGGTFQMGATAEQVPDASANEMPVHTVTLSSFSISKTEITQTQYRIVMGSNPSLRQGADLPVENINYNQAKAFCEKLSEKTGKHYQLPTEAQWEFAARGGNQASATKYAGSNDVEAVAWYAENAANRTQNVATKAPNALGLYDMSGNVMEWCSDKYGDYTVDAQTDPTGPTSGSKVVLRGGSYDKDASASRVSHRESIYPTRKGGNIGFRVVLVE